MALRLHFLMRAEPYQFSFDDEFQTMNSVILMRKQDTQDKMYIVLLVKNSRLWRVLSCFKGVFIKTCCVLRKFLPAAQLKNVTYFS